MTFFIVNDINVFDFLCRYELPIYFIVMNNNGIYSGLDEESWSNMDRERGELGTR